MCCIGYWVLGINLNMSWPCPLMRCDAMCWGSSLLLLFWSVAEFGSVGRGGGVKGWRGLEGKKKRGSDRLVFFTSVI